MWVRSASDDTKICLHQVLFKLVSLPNFWPNLQKAAAICDLHECLSQEPGWNHGVQDDRASTVRAPRGLFCQSTASQATATGTESRNKWGVRL